MKTTYKIDRPADMTATITITMTIGRWKYIAASLKENGPAMDLQSTVRELIIQAEGTIFHEVKERS